MKWEVRWEKNEIFYIFVLRLSDEICKVKNYLFTLALYKFLQMIYEYLEFLSVFFVFGSLFFWVSSLSVCVYHFQLSISTPIEKPVSSFSIISHPKHPAYWFWQSKIRMETVKLVQSTDLTHSFEWISFFLWSIVNLLDFCWFKTNDWTTIFMR